MLHRGSPAGGRPSARRPRHGSGKNVVRQACPGSQGGPNAARRPWASRRGRCKPEAAPPAIVPPRLRARVVQPAKRSKGPRSPVAAVQPGPSSVTASSAHEPPVPVTENQQPRYLAYGTALSTMVFTISRSSRRPVLRRHDAPLPAPWLSRHDRRSRDPGSALASDDRAAGSPGPTDRPPPWGPGLAWPGPPVRRGGRAAASSLGEPGSPTARPAFGTFPAPSSSPSLGGMEVERRPQAGLRIEDRDRSSCPRGPRPGPGCRCCASRSRVSMFVSASALR